MSRAVQALFTAIGLLMAPFSAGCSLGQGTGDVTSDQLNVDGCWCNAYRLGPNFFAAVPYRDTLQIRVQRGTDLQEVSDGLAVLVDNVKAIIPSEDEKAKGETRLLGSKLKVALPAGVELPGLGTGVADGGLLPPETPDEDDLLEGCGAEKKEPCGENGLAPLYDPTTPVVDALPIVHMALYLQQSCHNQNTVLYAVKGDIIFNKLFNGDPNEKLAANKYTEAIFDVDMVSLQDLPPGSQLDALPPDKITKLRGCFQFYFERGQPGQPFP